MVLTPTNCYSCYYYDKEKMWCKKHNKPAGVFISRCKDFSPFPIKYEVIKND